MARKATRKSASQGGTKPVTVADVDVAALEKCRQSLAYVWKKDRPPGLRPSRQPNDGEAVRFAIEFTAKNAR